MNKFKKKLFTGLVSRARGLITKHKKYVKVITGFVLGSIVLISIVFYIPEKLYAVFRRLFKKKTVAAGCTLATAALVVLCFVFLCNGRDTVAEETDTAQTTYVQNETIPKNEAGSETTEATLEVLQMDSADAPSEGDEPSEEQVVAEDAAYDEPADETASDNRQLINEIAATVGKWDSSKVDLGKLVESHSETVGWVYLENTDVSYPIMQCDDNEKYLSVGYNGEAANSGAIFLDCRSSADFSDSNSIVYGHNMRNDSMFGSLRQYREDPHYYDDHQYFQILTPNKKCRYQIFEYMDVSEDYVLYNYVSDAAKEFVQDAEPVRIKSYMDSEIVVNETKKVVTLSTCTYKDEKQFVVLGVLVDEVDY